MAKSTIEEVEVIISEEFEESLLNWNAMRISLSSLKEKEGKLRRELCSELFENMKKTKVNLVSETLKVKANNNVNVKIDDEALLSIFKDLSDNEKKSVKFKGSLVAKYFKDLPKNCNLMDVITETPGMPTLKIEFPKDNNGYPIIPGK